jgi:hypothetical protein
VPPFGIEHKDRYHSGLRDVSSRDDSEEWMGVMKVVTAKEQARVGGKDRRTNQQIRSIEEDEWRRYG